MGMVLRGGGGYLSKVSENITSGNGTGPLATFNPHCCSITRTYKSYCQKVTEGGGGGVQSNARNYFLQ